MKQFFIAALMGGLATTGFAQDEKPAEVTTAEVKPDESKTDNGEQVPKPELWFPVGETLVFKAYLGLIPVGSSTATSKWIVEKGKTYLVIQFRSRSNAFLDKIYPIDDFIESVIDPETFLPIRFTKRLSEGKYRCDETTVFDHEKLEAVWTAKQRGKNRTKRYKIDPDTRDLVAFMYNMRRTPVQSGDEKDFRVMSDEKIYDLKVTAHKKIDK
ncbi:MAG: DUF3108 domain-containing protein, partial [Verrucomicrobiota bacterium]